MLEERLGNIVCNATANFIIKFLNYLEYEKKYSSHTIIAYREDIFSFFSFLSDNENKNIISVDRLEKLTLTDFRLWLTQKLDKLDNRSRARKISSLRSLFNFLNRNNLLKNNEITKIKTPKISKLLPKPVSIENIKLIINEIKQLQRSDWENERDVAITLLLYGCGLRISEALSINKNSIANGEFIKIDGKGKKQRIVPMISAVSEQISIYLAICPFDIKNTQKIFRTIKNQDYYPLAFQNLILNLRRKFNLSENITPHSFRHSFASHLLEEGADIRSIQMLLGHEMLGTTEIYTKITKNNLISNHQRFFDR